ncbi:hypothetical protein FNL39_111152 [Nocardia caishijiensis]|uniref:Uncharacterized protein n=2 Tax=Nocardia caishijiensis TaxID=184756 RepID=A0ABQ6YG23_9NOCA|nr:hypothetical protein FNL39_111152 [Nocardia caishijiensis]
MWYVESDQSPLGTRDDLDLTGYNRLQPIIENAVLETIAVEGPLGIYPLMDKIVYRFGWERTSDKRRGPVLVAIPQELRRGLYVWPPNLDPKTWYGFRASPPGTRRTLEWICPEEIVNALCAVASNAPVGLTEEALFRAVLRVFGQRRISDEARAHLLMAKDRALASGRLLKDGADYCATVRKRYSWRPGQISLVAEGVSLDVYPAKLQTAPSSSGVVAPRFQLPRTLEEQLAFELYPGEQLWALVPVQGVQRMIDRVAITNSRVLGFSSFDFPRLGVKCSIEADDIASFDIYRTASGGIMTVATRHRDDIGFGEIVGEENVATVHHNLGRLVVAGFPPEIRAALGAIAAAECLPAPAQGDRQDASTGHDGVGALSDEMSILTIADLQFDSLGDEESFFGWLQRIGSVLHWECRHRTLEVMVGRPATSESLCELRALFGRYNISMDLLRDLSDLPRNI